MIHFLHDSRLLTLPFLGLLGFTKVRAFAKEMKTCYS